ncbi:uncharacterized protein THITE_2123490 [Thermothielavioides terrestris NRRL 8126]|uniref:Uncharacterized protein n=1 Tax=Thermothielavioides terrestris (strain ATCC 38088 / NRRL 8126) TaxID=578455 RepID=G2RHI2_THETT|nr:uncharacterized protein THITE_2123490 [Thermothielavioides terrestris NRRL 8126]AEO71294.1 hypothetical protein THITE_2123490 [Thermothielavioides terrestris NRRL 8126]
MLPAAHLRRRSRQEHHELGSTHSPASSPADSGYGTAPATPATPKKATERDRKSSIDIWVSCDGIQSDSDDPFIDSDSEQTFRGEVPASPVSPTTCIPPRNSDEKAVTLPKRPLRSRLTLPTSRSPFFKSTPQPQGPKTASVRHLDRFIPARATGTDASERFRTSKLPHNLTPAEKLLRHNGAAEDAFIYRRRVVTPLASEYRSPSGAESAASRNRGWSRNAESGFGQCSVLTWLSRQCSWSP